MRFEYSNQLTNLKSQVINLGNMVSSVFRDTITTVRDVDCLCAKKIIENDVNVDEAERDIENECLRILSLQRPFAFDLRLITGYLRIIVDLGRIADHCADVCEIISMKNLSGDHACEDQVVSILDKVFKIMFEEILKACFSIDTEIAKKVYKLDDEIDLMFSDVVFNVSASISDKISSVRLGADLMFIAKYAERIGDRCVNIARWIVYIHDGFFPAQNYFE